MTQNLGELRNNEKACMPARNTQRRLFLGLTAKRPDANAPEGAEDISVRTTVMNPFGAYHDYEPPAWLAVDAPAMAVDGEQVWAWVLWLTLTGLTFACVFKALVWFGGMP